MIPAAEFHGIFVGACGAKGAIAIRSSSSNSILFFSQKNNHKN
jgi:hypothetical protein